jgi:hypothetical protein
VTWMGCNARDPTLTTGRDSSCEVAHTARGHGDERPPSTTARRKEAARPLSAEGVTGRRLGLRSAVVSMGGVEPGAMAFPGKKQDKLATALAT